MSGRCALGLKEWAVLVDALAGGEQLILLRKGGIEDVGGEFRLQADSFILWPTYLHQGADWLRPGHAGRLERVLADRGEPDEVTLAHHAAVAGIHAVPSRGVLDELADEHVWSADYLDLRWRYRPELPLYLLLLRVSALPAPTVVRETTAQRGCRSWVELVEPVDLTGMSPALDDEPFGRRVERIRAVLAAR